MVALACLAFAVLVYGIYIVYVVADECRLRVEWLIDAMVASGDPPNRNQ